MKKNPYNFWLSEMKSDYSDELCNEQIVQILFPLSTIESQNEDKKSETFRFHGEVLRVGNFSVHTAAFGVSYIVI